MVGCKAGQKRYSGPCVPIVDEADADLLALRWTFHNHGYAHRKVMRPTPDGDQKQFTLLAHRVVMERVIGRPLTSAECCDHINHNRMDNRRSNLRIVSKAENMLNRRATAKNVTGYRGVSWSMSNRCWRADVTYRKKQYNCGFFRDPEQAAAAAWRKRRELGFPDEPALSFMTPAV